MPRSSAMALALLSGLFLGCLGPGLGPVDSAPFDCYQPGLHELRVYCVGPTLIDGEECPEGEVRINCTSVFVDGKPTEPTELEEDRCAPDETMREICGEVIPCTLAENGTVYPYCRE